MQNNRRVVITGLGALAPVGNNVPDIWKALLAGESGVAPITQFDASEYPIRIAGEVKGFNPEEYIDAKEARHMDRSVQLALASTKQALADARLEITEDIADRTGVVFGTGGGGFGSLLAQQKVMEEKGIRRVSPHLMPNFLPDSSSGHVAIATGARGPNMAVVSACATGGHAVGESMEIIRRDDADIMIAGGTEAGIYPIIVAGFISMRALADDPDPRAASKPFDARRNGFVLSEGTAVMILEELEHARRRGAHVYAEVVGYGSTNDAYHPTAPRPDGAEAARAMRRALSDGTVDPVEVDYVNAHGSSTPLGDRAEAVALRAVFGDRLAAIPVSGTKPLYGHPLGASGAIEAAIVCLVLASGERPAAINFVASEPGTPEAGLDLVGTNAHAPAGPPHVALSNSFGFGGINASLVFRRCES